MRRPAKAGPGSAGLAVQGDPGPASNGCGVQLSSRLYEHTAAVVPKIDTGVRMTINLSGAQQLFCQAALHRRGTPPPRRVAAGRWCRASSRRCSSSCFSISLGLVLRYLATGEGLTAATASIVVKTFVLYAIMITGSIWEHDVFGRYLFAPAFFWEDVFSMLVLALHTAYLVALADRRARSPRQMLLALAAYATYVDQRHAVRAEAARGPARGARLAAAARRRRELRPMTVRCRDIACRRRAGCVTHRSCASAASARCSAA